MIPFVRNLIEYSRGSDRPEYETLTECLHLKKDTKSITETSVLEIPKDYTCKQGLKRKATENKVYDLIIKTAESMIKTDETDSFLIENKIVLSIAIRLKAEEYLYNKLRNAGMTDMDIYSIGSPQTGKWIQTYKNFYPKDPNRSLIDIVNILTPEVVHINSFMYEPIIDMSMSHLVHLYTKCRDELVIINS